MRFCGLPISILTSVLLLAVGGARAQELQPSEYQLKAAFLYHFAQFIEWPPEAFANAASPLVIGVLGENPFGDVLEQTLNGRTLNNRPITTKEVRSVADATNNCQMLFISSSEKKRFPEIFAALRDAGVLTVGEAEHFTETGGMINFVRQGNKIRFQINDEAARRAGLKIRSKLLSLALRPAS